MNPSQEFHYRLPGRVAGGRPGAHAGTALGTGQMFVTHVSLFQMPDPRRLDLRASLRSLQGDWLVKLNRQRSATRLMALVDVSASMAFGMPRRKLEVAADVVEAIGLSAYRLGDAAGLAAFDSDVREDLFRPASVSRGAGPAMAQALRECVAEGRSAEGVRRAAEQIAGRDGLVFLISDFHWPLDELAPLIDRLRPARLVPIVVWDPAEADPPAHDAYTWVRDSESGASRHVWLRPALRARWRDAVAARREALIATFARRDVTPFFVQGAFDAESLSRHFLDHPL